MEERSVPYRLRDLLRRPYQAVLFEKQVPNNSSTLRRYITAPPFTSLSAQATLRHDPHQIWARPIVDEAW